MRSIFLMIIVLSLTSFACDDGGGVDPAQCVPAGTQFCVTVCDPPGAATGVRTCSADKTWGTCIPPSEICDNGRDDDCDGDVDEDCVVDPGGDCTPGASQACVVTNGACQATGAQTCKNNETWGACVPPQELCNEIDDDCNGQIDDVPNGCGEGPQPCEPDNSTRPCVLDCGPVGEQICVNGFWAPCNKPETCNGFDDDCDGETDEIAPGQLLSQDCENDCGQGQQECANGTWSTCSVHPEEEICDEVDNDCDGFTDEDCDCTTGDTAVCGTTDGECNPGIKTCNNFQWGPCGGETYQGPTDEKCNGLDDDCDGHTDEGNPEGGIQACGTPNTAQGGTKYAPCTLGEKNCIAGQLVCEGGVDPTPELCDGIDNDCNGQIDDDAQADQFDPNDSCLQAADLGAVVENQGPQEIQGTLYQGEGATDVDWYFISGSELSNICFGGDEGPYTFTVTLKDLPQDFDLCVWSENDADCGDLPSTGLCEELEIWKSGTESETYTYTWTGKCFENDDLTFYVKVVNYMSDYDCAPYTLEYELTSD